MAGKLTYDAAQEYINALVPPRAKELQDMEDYANERGFPIIGPACGYYCYQLARMINAKSIFELGSGYGYSTAWFAQAVEENGGEWCITLYGTMNFLEKRKPILLIWAGISMYFSMFLRLLKR